MSVGGRRPRAAVNGILLLDKPAGITSQTAVSHAKRLFNALKAGHTGTLDPLATGLLPIAFGEATKFSGVLLDAAKGYEASVRLGVTTTTGDLEGDVVSTASVEATREQVEAALEPFRGTIVQIPPMYSALKHQGRALYEYARAGAVVERAPREVKIEALELRWWAPPDLGLAVRCSKGTYVRVLAEDLGRALDSGACLAGLRRTGVGPFDVAQALTFETLEALSESHRMERLLPVDAMLGVLPLLRLDARSTACALRGQTFECAAAHATGTVRLYGVEGQFLGVGEVQAGGRVQPRRLIAAGPQNA